MICAERLGACVEGFMKKMLARLRIWKQNKASREHLKENHDDHQKWLEREKLQNLGLNSHASLKLTFNFQAFQNLTLSTRISSV